MKHPAVKKSTAARSVHIHIQGKVQGVGFRPFVYRMARKYRLTGWVNNGMDGVHVEAHGEPGDVTAFCLALRHEHPAIATITAFDIHPIDVARAEDFRVTESDSSGSANVLILPDLDVCSDCLQELSDRADRRHHYAFITCTNCGPRYSIITRLPYDRPHTTMAGFPLCKMCAKEYHDPADRRFYSQTNSCPDCGIRLTLHDASRKSLATGVTAIEQAGQALIAGKIIAMKGIGGYLLMTDALNDDAVQELRRRKHRPCKPFALMCPNIDEVLKDVQACGAELRLLQSREKPIVILKKKLPDHRIAASVAPNHDTLGIMLPYAPLHHLLLQTIGRPVVATSANISGSPILATEAQVFTLLRHVADLFLVHDRDIAVPQDDSVVRLTPDSKTPIFLRRSRSFAPLFPHNIVRLQNNHSILALGAQQKSSLTLTHEGNIYVSQYLGDLTNFETEQNFHALLRHFSTVLAFSPQQIAVDRHPQYAATAAGEALARERNLPLTRVQHHRAHFWAVLAENGLLHSQEPVLGVIWDGTGWGDDEAIWGSEFFLFHRGEMTRVAHLDYFPLLLGDKSALEPRLPALALWQPMADAADMLTAKFSATELRIYRQYLQREKYFLTSSMGRLFDGVASMLGIADRVSYEGEAAMQLEKYAQRFRHSRNGRTPGCPWPDATQFDPEAGVIRFAGLCRHLLEDIQRGDNRERIAFHFHQALVQVIGQVIDATGVQHVAASGGVFQNAVLVDLLTHHLQNKARLYLHKHLSPNDESISFGQMICVAYEQGWL